MSTPEPPTPFLTCDDCHESKEDVKETICPYDGDLFGKETPATLCEDCRNARSMEL